MADRVRAAVVAQGIQVPDVDQDVYGASALSDTLKWETTPGWFGYLWLKARDRRAGWWTREDGSHDFTKVEALGTSTRPHFVLSYENGWVEIFIEKDGRLSGRWFRGSGRNEQGAAAPWDFQGKLVLGHVHTP